MALSIELHTDTYQKVLYEFSQTVFTKAITALSLAEDALANARTRLTKISSQERITSFSHVDRTQDFVQLPNGQRYLRGFIPQGDMNPHTRQRIDVQWDTFGASDALTSLLQRNPTKDLDLHREKYGDWFAYTHNRQTHYLIFHGKDIDHLVSHMPNLQPVIDRPDAPYPHMWKMKTSDGNIYEEYKGKFTALPSTLSSRAKTFSRHSQLLYELREGVYKKLLDQSATPIPSPKPIYPEQPEWVQNLANASFQISAPASASFPHVFLPRRNADDGKPTREHENISSLFMRSTRSPLFESRALGGPRPTFYYPGTLSVKSLIDGALAEYALKRLETHTTQPPSTPIPSSSTLLPRDTAKLPEIVLTSTLPARRRSDTFARPIYAKRNGQVRTTLGQWFEKEERRSDTKTVLL